MIDETARHLIEARRTQDAVSAAGLCPADAQAAYAAQNAVAQACGWFGNVSPGYWKSGGPSRQAVLTHAPLPPDGVWSSPAAAGAWPFHMRGIEAEIALRLGCDVDPALALKLDVNDAVKLVDAMCVSIEIVDSRWVEGLEAPALAKLADLQSHGALVLGPWVPFSQRDWLAQVCRVQIGVQPPVERQGTHSLADPAFLLAAWLRHATHGGHSILAGTVVTTGTWVGILTASAGDLVTAEFPGIGNAAVQL
ncbi:fumarylacetoacetate hydrolase family protein [Polaromonas glacialis]|uniref:fumarylacetoacetate hydrolase family protein n=1 Tax=Polaromonas glacialis TaxID=866564 RepID=UPI00049603DB|nr:fumarylacetoacetate hydrolase family protein [Polaromonas glacialis]